MHECYLKTQSDLEELLLEKYFNRISQLTIDTLLGNKMSREYMIKESYNLANKEIGYRAEKINKLTQSINFTTIISKIHIGVVL